MNVFQEISYKRKQQVPKPEAQFPSILPPASEHSELVMQMPLLTVSVFKGHSSLGKDTTEKKEMAFCLFPTVATTRLQNSQVRSTNFILPTTLGPN